MPVEKQLATRWTVDSGSCFGLAGSATVRNTGCSMKQVASHKPTPVNGWVEVSEEASVRTGELGLNTDVMVMDAIRGICL